MATIARLVFFVGVGKRWTVVRKVYEGETTNDIFAFVIAEPNAVPRPVASSSPTCHDNDDDGSPVTDRGSKKKSMAAAAPSDFHDTITSGGPSNGDDCLDEPGQNLKHHNDSDHQPQWLGDHHRHHGEDRGRIFHCHHDIEQSAAEYWQASNGDAK